MKNKEIMRLHNGLLQLGNLQGGKFAFAITKNIGILQPEIDALNAIIKISDEYKVFDEERIKLLIEISEKDKDGNPVIVNNNYKVDKSILDKKLAPLGVKHKKVIDLREKQVKDYNDILEENSDKKKMFKMKLEVIPDEITVAQMNSIKDLVEG